MHRRSCILALFTLVSASAASAQSLVAHWRLDEAAGTLCADSSGTGTNGAYLAGIQLGQPGARPGTGTSVRCDGLSGGVEFVGATSLDGLVSGFTVASWALIDDPTFYRVLLGNASGWVVGSFYNNLRFTTRGVQDYIQAGAPVGQWFHYAVTFDNSFLATFYVDGVAIGSIQGASPPFTPAPSWYLGTLDGGTELWSGSIDDVQVYDGVLTPGQIAELFANPGQPLGVDLGVPYCGPAALNSSGQSAVLTASGSPTAAANDVTLTASNVPPFQFGFFITSRVQGLIPNPGGSPGNVCLGGVIGRYNATGQILNAGAAGTFSLPIDLTATPEGGAVVSVMAGETRYFQAWFRDFAPGGAQTSNFTNGLGIAFL